MAVAGKVAITLSTENGGAWSANVTYDRLVAVKHNNNLYISRKTVANVEPPNNEFWFLALEGYSGADVQALIDRLNELSDLIQAIITGTQQVGNAKTLDGHGAEEFANSADLANYLPLSGTAANSEKLGGKDASEYVAIATSTGQTTVRRYDIIPLAVNSITSGTNSFFGFYNNDVALGFLGFLGANVPVVLSNNGSEIGKLLHTGNKPTGTYTGNGDGGSRTISVGGIGGILAISTDTTLAIVGNGGFVAVDGSTGTITGGGNAFYSNGNLYCSTSHGAINANGVIYTYHDL